MTLEQLHGIDIVTAPAPNKIGLHIVDTGAVIDPEERYLRLMAKLLAYVRYVQSVQFGDEHPGMAVEDVVIFVEHFTPLSPSMAGIVNITPHGKPTPRIPVIFVDHAGGMY